MPSNSNRGVVYLKPSRVEVQKIDFPSFRNPAGETILVNFTISGSSRPGARRAGLLGRDVAAKLGKALDPLLDVAERLEAGFDRVDRDISQHVGCDGVAQTVEIIDKLPAACREK